MAALLLVQQLCPVTNSSNCTVGYSDWHDVTSISQFIPDPYFSPVDYNSTYDAYYPTGTVRNDVVISSTLYESRPGAKFSPLFATEASIFEREPGLNVDLLICADGTQTSRSSPDSPSSRCNNVAYTTYRSWTNASYGFFEARMQNLSHNLCNIGA